MESLHERTKIRAFVAGQSDSQDGKPCDSKSKTDSMWDAEYKRGYNQFSGCGCSFENSSGNSVLLCAECSKLPCHNP
jgi:hypothetical protein